MASAKIVVVHGATGLQGGSVARHLASLGYSVRAIVRDPSAPNAAALAETSGISLTHVPDILDTATLRTAYEGAYAVFGCTAITPDEEEQGKAMGDTALAAGVKVFVWSSLESIEAASGGKYTGVSSFENKARVSEYLVAEGVPAVHLIVGSFMENFCRVPGVLKLTPSGEIELRSPMYNLNSPMSLIHIKKDLPSIVEVVLAHPDAFLGRKIVAAPTILSLVDVATRIEAVTGHKTTALETPIPPGIPQWFETVIKFSKDETVSGPGWARMGIPRIDPKLAEYGFVASPVDDFVKDEVVPFLQL